MKASRPRIVPFWGPVEQTIDRVRGIRATGDVPLVGDPRWPDEQWDAITALVADAAVPASAAWATTTSGTSGAPRVLLRTHESWRASFATVAALLGSPPAAGVVLPAPPASSLTLFSIAHSLAGGPRALLARDAIGDAFHGTPQGLQELLESDRSAGVRTALIGGSDLDARVRAQAQERGIRVISYYGAAELSFVAVDDGSGLRPFPGASYEVRGGELWVRSPFVALGYVGSEGPLRRDGEWATVGDLARIDDGVLRLRGRADGAIITASATVIPEEVEAALRRMPGVADVVVFGLPVPRVGMIVAAHVQIDAGATDAAALRAGASRVLNRASRPRFWFTGDLPRTSAGKPARAEIVRRALAGEAARLV